MPRSLRKGVQCPPVSCAGTLSLCSQEAFRQKALEPSKAWRAIRDDGVLDPMVGVAVRHGRRYNVRESFEDGAVVSISLLQDCNQRCVGSARLYGDDPVRWGCTQF